METRLTLIAPEDVPDVIAMLREWRLNRSSPRRNMQSGLVTTPTPLYVRNVSGAVIPPYACMQATGTEDDSDTGQNYIEVDQPADVDGSTGAFLFNGPEEIAVGADGVAQNSRVVRAIKDTGTATAGDSWQPIVSSWEIAVGGSAFVMVGDDDIVTDCVRVFYAGGGSGGGETRLFRFTLNESLASGTADADILLMDGTDTGIDATVRDPLGIFVGLTTVGSAGLCLRQNGLYYVIQAPCPA